MTHAGRLDFVGAWNYHPFGPLFHAIALISVLVYLVPAGRRRLITWLAAPSTLRMRIVWSLFGLLVAFGASRWISPGWWRLS